MWPAHGALSIVIQGQKRTFALLHAFAGGAPAPHRRFKKPILASGFSHPSTPVVPRLDFL
jgi:hypothetical protein